ncbi:MAG: hypothetical protein H6737_04900 [Alphaproteobacteria bacterium]|nr:hypothetical protein [Alphaproteobacteria bacterium]
MGDLIDLDQRRRDRQLAEAVGELSERMRGPVPPPEHYGWIPTRRDEAGRPTRWMLPAWPAFIGFVPGAPERVYLDARNQIRAWDGLPIEDLALGIEMGTLPEPDVTLDWRGDPVVD